MANYNPYRNRAIFYTYAACNLRCKYCNIDKNPALYTIDKMLEKSFEDVDYYTSRLKSYFLPWQLERIETWGGEPFLGMHRLYNLIDYIIPQFPKFSEFFSSTNFSYPQWNDEFWGLIDVFRKYPNRRFLFDLQLSCDGPTYINDLNRGKGTTEKCIKVFDQLCEELKSGKLPENVDLKMGIKGTLSTDNIRQLQTKEAIIEYYKFLEDNFISKIMFEGKPKNVFMECTTPNNASPSPITVELGQLMANFTKLCKQIQDKNLKSNRIFDYYQIITPYFPADNEPMDKNQLSFCNHCGACGTGESFLGFLPDDYVTICNEGFVELIGDYNSLSKTTDYRLDDGVINFKRFINPEKSFMCLTDEEYVEYERKMSLYRNSPAKNATIATEIVCLAMAGQVEEQYLDPFMASKAAAILSNRFAYCIKDNKNETGTMSLIPFGYLKLFLNGMLQEVMSPAEWEVYRYEPN